MKEYNLYVPFEPGNGSASGWVWLERLLKQRFGQFSKSVGTHEGSWSGSGVTFEGRVNSYSLCAEEKVARPFFRDLKRKITEEEHSEVLIVEKPAPGPKGEMAGERI